MAQKLIRIGTSTGITLPKAAMERLGIATGDRVDVEFDRKMNAVVIRPVQELSRASRRIARLGAHFIDRYRKDLEALANK